MLTTFISRMKRTFRVAIRLIPIVFSFTSFIAGNWIAEALDASGTWRKLE